MKILVNDPKVSATMYGGCTFETRIGWWTHVYVDDSERPSLGAQEKIFEDTRNAIYIPTLQKNGEPVSVEKITELKAVAFEHGFNNVTSAAGVWVLSTTGEAQVEYIWICWTNSPLDLGAKLREFAELIKNETNQDCVAWEENGNLKFTACA